MDTKRGENFMTADTKHSKYLNKIRTADRKSTPIARASEGSPRAALVNFSASYTGFT